MKIKVTTEDISIGVCGSARRCPIAIGIGRARKSDGDVFVKLGDRIIVLCDSLERERIVKCPMRVVDAASFFDDFGKMEPFEFTLDMGR